jgi:hypothetical protein
LTQGIRNGLFFFAELLMALFMLPEEIAPETRGPSWAEKQLGRMAEELCRGTKR